MKHRCISEHISEEGVRRKNDSNRSFTVPERSLPVMLTESTVYISAAVRWTLSQRWILKSPSFKSASRETPASRRCVTRKSLTPHPRPHATYRFNIRVCMSLSLSKQTHSKVHMLISDIWSNFTEQKDVLNRFDPFNVFHEKNNYKEFLNAYNRRTIYNMKDA